MGDNGPSVEDLLNQLNQAGKGYDVPAHVATRIFALVGGNVDVVDVVNEAAGNNLVGAAVLLTETVVVHAQWATLGWSERPSAEATVTVEAWPRWTLRSVALLPTPTGERRHGMNLDEQWRDSGGEWPWSGQLTLRYAGRDGDLLLPLNPHRPSSKAVRNMMDLAVTFVGDLDGGHRGSAAPIPA